MIAQLRLNELRTRRKIRVRKKVKGTNRNARKRIIFNVTNKHLYAQLVDDATGKTMFTVSTSGSGKKAEKNRDAATRLALEFAGKVNAVQMQNEDMVFDRGMRLYHGKVKAFAEALREKGLKF